ncbi:hypothetical protein PC116_g20663 [Phytophthora cactorum]|nr:hypothetical protein PC119_g15880 [Phytophthora cactorum]KAG4231057.1 hypothetical protein PC116_g20663 [Phytophthora cactorum]
MPDSFILHTDATYKTNHRGYPVVVIGVSDRTGDFTSSLYSQFLKKLKKSLKLWYYLYAEFSTS